MGVVGCVLVYVGMGVAFSIRGGSGFVSVHMHLCSHVCQ